MDAIHNTLLQFPDDFSEGLGHIAFIENKINKGTSTTNWQYLRSLLYAYHEETKFQVADMLREGVILPDFKLLGFSHSFCWEGWNPSVCVCIMVN